MELRTLDDLRAAVHTGRVIVITDTATGAKAHHANCRWVGETYFKAKVSDGGAKNGSYFAVATLDDARSVHGAAPCPICNPSR